MSRRRKSRSPKITLFGLIEADNTVRRTFGLHLAAEVLAMLRATGKGHPCLSDVTDAFLRFTLEERAGCPEAEIPQFCEDGSEHRLWKYTRREPEGALATMVLSTCAEATHLAVLLPDDLDGYVWFSAAKLPRSAS